MASVNTNWNSKRVKREEEGEKLDALIERLEAEALLHSTGYRGKGYDADITRFFHFAAGQAATNNDYRATRGGFRDAAIMINGRLVSVEIKRGAGDLSRNFESKEDALDYYGKLTGLCVWSYNPPHTDANPLVMRWCDLLKALDGYKKGRTMFFKYNKNTGVFGVQEVTNKNDRKQLKIAFLDGVRAQGYDLRTLGYSRQLVAWRPDSSIIDYLDAALSLK